MNRGAIFAAALAIAVAFGAGGCTSAPWAGIPLHAGAADPELQSLARRAADGNKQAQLDLGIRFEEGRGVSVDLARAAQLYRMAATDSTGGIQVYVPNANGPGHVETINIGAPVQGLKEAARRLSALELAASRSNVEAHDQNPTYLRTWSYPYEGHEVFVEPPVEPLEFTVRKWRYLGRLSRSGENRDAGFPCDALEHVLPYYFGQGVESCSSLPVTVTVEPPSQTLFMYDLGVNLEPSEVNPDAPRFLQGVPTLSMRSDSVCGEIRVDHITIKGGDQYNIITDIDDERSC